MKLIRVATFALGVAAAVPAAALTTIASYGTSSSAANVRWQGSGANGHFFTIASSSATVPGATAVDFSFLMPALAPYVTHLPAKFSLDATVTAGPAVLFAGQLFQGKLTGNFAVVSSAPLTVGGKTYAAGANLLSGTFTQTLLYGTPSGTVATMLAATSGGSAISMTSDFLDFTGVANYSVNLPLSAVRPALFAASGSALRSFVATSSGAFGSDAPAVTAVPEPESWALLIAGFAMVGVAARRRNRLAVAA